MFSAFDGVPPGVKVLPVMKVTLLRESKVFVDYPQEFLKRNRDHLFAFLHLF